MTPANAASDLAASRARLAELEAAIAAADRAQADAASGIAQTQSTIAEVDEQAEALEHALDKLRAGHATPRTTDRRPDVNGCGPGARRRRAVGP